MFGVVLYIVVEKSGADYSTKVTHRYGIRILIMILIFFKIHKKR